MTVALVFAAEADAAMCGQLAALGVRRVDLAGRADAASAGLLTVAAAARTAGEKVIICVGDGPVPGEVLARLLAAGTTAVFNGGIPMWRDRAGGDRAGGDRTEGDRADNDRPEPASALIVDTPDLPILATAAESLAADSTPWQDPLAALVTELAGLGVRIQVLDAGTDGDGEVAQRLADPLAQDIAQWALPRKLTPESLCGIAIGFGLIATAWFTSDNVLADLLAPAALAASFVTGRAAALLAASGRWASPSIDWLTAATALAVEFGCYCALAFRPGDGLFVQGPGDNWRLAMAAAGVLGVRRLAELTFDRSCEEQGTRRAVLKRFEQAITLPAGERLLVIALVTVLAGPRITFEILLGWGAIAIVYLLTGRVMGSAIATAVTGPAKPLVRVDVIGDVAAYRDDGVLAHWIGGIVEGRLPPLLPALTGVLVTSVLAAFGMSNLPGILILTPVEAMLLGALGACHPHDGKRDWFAPPLLLAGEFVYLAALGLAHDVPLVITFALLAAVVLRHIDVAYRARHFAGISADLLGLGWDGRMLLLGLAAMLGIAPFAYGLVAAYLWLLVGWDFLGGWLVDSAAQDGQQDGQRDRQQDGRQGG